MQGAKLKTRSPISYYNYVVYCYCMLTETLTFSNLLFNKPNQTYRKSSVEHSYTFLKLSFQSSGIYPSIRVSVFKIDGGVGGEIIWVH